MTKEVIYEISQNIKNDSLISEEEFSEMYQHSIANPDEFWNEQASNYLDWISEWDQVSEHNFSKGEVSWFKGGKLNATINCIDRHLDERAEQKSIGWTYFIRIKRTHSRTSIRSQRR